MFHTVLLFLDSIATISFGLCAIEVYITANLTCSSSYPTDSEKDTLAQQTGLSRCQVIPFLFSLILSANSLSITLKAT